MQINQMQTGMVCLPPVIVLQDMKTNPPSCREDIFTFLPIQVWPSFSKDVELSLFEYVGDLNIPFHASCFLSVQPDGNLAFFFQLCNLGCKRRFAWLFSVPLFPFHFLSYLSIQDIIAHYSRTHNYNLLQQFFSRNSLC